MQYSSDQTQVSDGLDHIHPVIQYKILHIPSCGYFLHEISLPAILFYKTYQEIHIFSRHRLILIGIRRNMIEHIGHI